MILRSNGRQEDKAMRERPVRLLLGLKKDHYAIQDLLAEIVVDDGAVPALSQNLVNPPTLSFSFAISFSTGSTSVVCGRSERTNLSAVWICSCRRTPGFHLSI